MKHIDTKSFIIGILATALFLACSDTIKKAAIPEAQAATGVGDKWDNKQEWLTASSRELKEGGFISNTDAGFRKVSGGWEPWTIGRSDTYYRKRIK